MFNVSINVSDVNWCHYYSQLYFKGQFDGNCTEGCDLVDIWSTKPFAPDILHICIQSRKQNPLGKGLCVLEQKQDTAFW